jgi:hypothetical protein
LLFKVVTLLGLWIYSAGWQAGDFGIGSSAFALSFIGAREAAMGGCGVASSIGMTAVAYNPAGFLGKESFDFKLSVGGATQGMDQLSSAIGNSTNLAEFMLNNLANQLNANGSFFGLCGISLNNIGLSAVVPDLQGQVTKNAGEVNGNASAQLRYDAVVTLGTTLNFYDFPIDNLNVGTNLKMIYYGYGQLEAAGTLPVTATETWGQGNGFGLDLGARTNFEVPYLSSLVVGLAIKDLVSTVTIAEPSSRTDTFNADNTITEGTVTVGSAQQITYPVNIVLGCAGKIPVIDLEFALDYESLSGGSGAVANTDTILHFGLEYPMLDDLLKLRAGLASSQNIARNTLGFELSFVPMNVAAAAVFDGHNSLNNAYIIEIGSNL